MIEDKEIGLKVAEDKDETYYLETKEKIEAEILRAKRTLEFDEILLEYVNKKLKKYKK